MVRANVRLVFCSSGCRPAGQSTRSLPDADDDDEDVPDST
jgi:hypothetical protein